MPPGVGNRSYSRESRHKGGPLLPIEGADASSPYVIEYCALHAPYRRRQRQCQLETLETIVAWLLGFEVLEQYQNGRAWPIGLHKIYNAYFVAMSRKKIS